MDEPYTHIAKNRDGRIMLFKSTALLSFKDNWVNNLGGMDITDLIPVLNKIKEMDYKNSLIAINPPKTTDFLSKQEII